MKEVKKSAKTSKILKSAKTAKVQKTPKVSEKVKAPKARILWIDITKAIAILSVIISHTIPLDWPLRTAIFSFHMPLFFILSGYTTKLAPDWPTLKKRMTKYFKRLILPALFAISVFAVFDAIKFGNILESPLRIVYWLRVFFLNPHPEGLDMVAVVWFLVALFWVKVAMDLVNVVFKTEKNGIIFFFLGVAGLLCGVNSLHLPAFLDSAMVGVLFVYVGMFWRKNATLIEKYRPYLLIIAGTFWVSQVVRGVYLEMWRRFYAGYELSILAAIAGAFLISELAMMFELSKKSGGKVMRKLVDLISYLGQNTLILLIIHALDMLLFGRFWDLREGTPWTTKSILISCALRLLLNLLTFTLVCLFKEKIKKNRLKRKIKA